VIRRRMVLALTTPIGAALLAGLALLWFRGHSRR
jgi:hypothetical protein